jgi:sialidase-1
MKFSLVFLLAIQAMLAAPPLLEKTDLWQADQYYAMYRIPGIVVTKSGVVLAYCEARKSGNDWASIDVVMRRSTDGGVTFSEQKVISHVAGKIDRNPVAIERKQSSPTDVTHNNPVAIVDRNGSVHFLFCLEYMRVFYMRSDDDGKTFTEPVEITSAFERIRPSYAWRVVATGPGHGIQLENGRLLVPVWYALGTGGNGHHPSVNGTVYSDDHGKTWKASDVVMKSTPEFPDPNETTAAQLANGSVMLNVRTEAKENRRTVIVSPNGANDWGEPHLQNDLPDPVCFASLTRLSLKKKGRGRNRLLFSNPDNVTRVDGKQTVSKDRVKLTVHLSYDEGKSWTVKRSLEEGSSGYSDMSVLPDGTILCLYETGRAPGSFPDRKLVLARFNLEWLSEGKDSWK